MRKIIPLIAATFTLALIAGPVWAKTVQISGTHSEGEIEATCNRVGGHFSGTVSGYFCVNDCGNDTCSVSCNRKTATCTGTVPHGRPSHTLGGILHPPYAGNKYSGSNEPPKGHHHSVRISGFKPPSGIKTIGGGQPVTVMHTEQRHSGDSHK